MSELHGSPFAIDIHGIVNQHEIGVAAHIGLA
jgi:hypothetical protein